jgi:hypothetical protein
VIKHILATYIFSYVESAILTISTTLPWFARNLAEGFALETTHAPTNVHKIVDSAYTQSAMSSYHVGTSLNRFLGMLYLSPSDFSTDGPYQFIDGKPRYRDMQCHCHEATDEL